MRRSIRIDDRFVLFLQGHTKGLGYLENPMVLEKIKKYERDHESERDWYMIKVEWAPVKWVQRAPFTRWAIIKDTGYGNGTMSSLIS